jgi:glucokinase
VARAPLLVGVDLGGTNVRAGLVDGSRLRAIDARPIRSRGTKHEVFADVCASIDAVMTKGVRSIGIGVPSLVQPATGTILDTTNIPSWKRVALRGWLERKYRVPVFIDNDANCLAIGERYFGHGRGCDDFVALVIGTGLGAGIVSNGRLHSGTDCAAGEVGTVPYRDATIERYASGQLFQLHGREGGALAADAERGDPAALALFAEYGRHLAHAVTIVLYVLAPQKIILGGSVSKSWKHFEQPMRDALRDFAYPSVVRGVKFHISRVKHAAVLGAASLGLDKSVGPRASGLRRAAAL